MGQEELPAKMMQLFLEKTDEEHGITMVNILKELERNGISHFVEHTVFKGTKKRNSLQISEDIENGSV